MTPQKVEIYVQARMGSTRLPGKVLKQVNGYPLLGYLLDRLAAVKEADKVVVLTSVLATDDPIVEMCQNRGAPVFRGPEQDVLARYYQAAEKYTPDAVVRITADCPLIDPAIVDQCIRMYKEKFPLCDYVSNTLQRTFPRGLDVEVFSAEVLSKMYFTARTPAEREHVTPYIGNHPALFRIQQLTREPSYADYSITVDTPADFARVEKVIKHFYPKNVLFSVEELVKVISTF